MKGSRGKLNWEKQVGACRAVLIDGLSPWVCGIFTQTFIPHLLPPKTITIILSWLSQIWFCVISHLGNL